MAGAVYWVGADGNVYAKGLNGHPGVANLGSSNGANYNLSGGGFESNTLGQSVQATRINDPNPPAQNNNGGGGGGGGGGSSFSSNNSGAASAAALAAQQAAQAAALARAETAYHNQTAATNSAIDSSVTSGGGDYNASILDAFNGSGGFKDRQATINNEGTQNELSKLSGMQGVRDMVNNGIQGGGVMLDNAGAGTSSAGEALARAYGVQGRQQASKVGTQYEQGKNTINTEQDSLNRNEDQFQNVDMPTKKQDIIATIVSNANSALNSLNFMAMSASLPDQINIAQRIAEVKAQATAALTQFDGELQGSRAANTPMSQDSAMSQAQQMLQKGTAPAKEFDYTATAPAQLQNTGPAASSLPIYIASPQNKNDNGIPV